MHFVYRTRHSGHVNNKAPDWCLIDFKHKGLRTGWQLNDPINNWVWGEDIYQEIKAHPENFLIVEAKDYDHLLMTKEYKDKWNEYVKTAIKPESNLGWIAPDGTFIGCDYYDHAFVAEEYLHSSEERLEEEGWCKIYALGEKAAACNCLSYYSKHCHLTSAQKETLDRHYEKFDVYESSKKYYASEGII